MAITAGEWYHIAGVIRGANDMDIFINGRDAGGTYSGYGGELSYSGNPPIIGRGSVIYPLDHFYGAMDDFRYYTRSLDAEEIIILSAATFFVNIEEKIMNEQTIVYPNPSSNGLFHFNIPSNDEDYYEITIFNAKGAIVKEFATSQPKFNLQIPDKKSGLYFYRINSENELISRGTLTIID